MWNWLQDRFDWKYILSSLLIIGIGSLFSEKARGAIGKTLKRVFT